MSDAPHTWPRLFVSAPLRQGGTAPLSLQQTRYLVHVLRAREGAPVRLFNGRDGEWLATVPVPPRGKKEAMTLVVHERRRAQASEPDVWLCCAPIKHAHFDFMIQKATELGVAVIQPFLTARTQVRETNGARLAAIAVEAAEQSERLSVPEIRVAVALESLAAAWPAGRLPLICAEFGDASPIAQGLRAASASCRAAAIVTGPEGGFTQQEMDALKTLPDALALRLGPRILRADTAALAALACWQSLCGDWIERTQSEEGGADYVRQARQIL